MKINLYVTHYELFNLQNSVPINSEIFWMLGEFLSVIEEEIDKEMREKKKKNLYSVSPL